MDSLQTLCIDKLEQSGFDIMELKETNLELPTYTNKHPKLIISIITYQLDYIEEEDYKNPILEAETETLITIIFTGIYTVINERRYNLYVGTQEELISYINKEYENNLYLPFGKIEQKFNNKEDIMKYIKTQIPSYIDNIAIILQNQKGIKLLEDSTVDIVNLTTAESCLDINYEEWITSKLPMYIELMRNVVICNYT